MKKLPCLFITLMFLCGCAHGARGGSKYPGWEQVRIESQVPQKDCVYKTQEGCGSSNCFNWFKKRATLYGANVVVIKSLSKGQETVGYFNQYGGSVGTVDTMSGLADYYHCSNYQFTGENK